jgi:hypothetical protein
MFKAEERIVDGHRRTFDRTGDARRRRLEIEEFNLTNRRVAVEGVKRQLLPRIVGTIPQERPPGD